MLIFLLSLITLAVCASQIINFRRLCAYVENALAGQCANYLPKLSVILPCKGLDPDFDANIAKLLNQDYVNAEGRPNYEVIFVTASAEDPAYQPLCLAKDNASAVFCRVIVAGLNKERAQKINNQLAALSQAAPDSEVLVFVDSDVIARDDFLRHLVAPLSNPKIGATTGYRFYVPEKGGWPGLIRALWNRMTAWEMAHPKYAFAWGGAMAIKKSTFAEAQIARLWDKAADDDLSLTTAVKGLGLSVHFVPQCLVASQGDASLAEVLEWTNRQVILTKVYYPRLWLRAIERAAIMAVWLFAIFFALWGALSTGKADCFWALSIGLCILPIETWFLLRAQKLWQKVLVDRHDFLDTSLWRFILALPLAHLLLPWMTLYSLCTNRIQWRGVTYELKSPMETLVVDA